MPKAARVGLPLQFAVVVTHGFAPRCHSRGGDAGFCSEMRPGLTTSIGQERSSLLSAPARDRTIVCMTLEAYCQTDIGLRRERNEDSFLIDESLGLFLVADGMGGHRGGEVASRLAVESAREVVFRHSKDNRRMMPRQLLAEAYREASHRIFDKARSEGNQELQGMGTTLVCAYRYRNTLYIANVGDSRAYLFSDPYLWQVTEDHSLLNEQLRAGLFSERDIASFGAKNVITRSVGFERDVMCDIVERDVRPGEMILMCSDGLSGLVTDTRIADILRTTSVDQIVSTCINEAKKNGGDDNVTCMLLYARPQEH